MFTTVLRRNFSYVPKRTIGTTQTSMAKAQSNMDSGIPPQIPFFDHSPPKYTGPSYEDVAKMRKAHVHPASFLLYKDPLMIVDGSMQYLYDHTGRRYLDLFAGVSTSGMGHCHPRITSKMKEQCDKLQHTTTIYMNDEHSLYAQELAEKLPEGLDVILFMSSGSEANAMATQMARSYTGNFPIITLKNGYHGMSGTQHLSSIGSWNHNIPRTQGIETAAFPDMYRGPWDRESDAAHFYSNDVKDTIAFNTSGKIALFMAEAVQGVGGLVPLPEDYVRQAVTHVKKAGGLYLSDEVQTGFGRIGSHYWGCDMVGVKPDIITMAKQQGNGFPLAAVATTREIADNFSQHQKLTFTTYGGNPIAMAVGREVLRVIDDENLQENSNEMGKLFMTGLNEIKSRVHTVGDVRGKGLMIGVEIVQDQESNEPADAAYFAKVYEKTKDYGILLGKGGRYGNVLRLQPPMCLNAQDVEFTLDVLERALVESM